MALQEQKISFQFAGGIETKMDPKAVPSARLLALENGVFTRAISIKKRNGYEKLSRAIISSPTTGLSSGHSSSPGATTSALVTGARRLAVRDAELLQFTAVSCYSKQSDADQWADAGPVIGTVGSDKPVVNTSSQQTMPDQATSNGVTVFAWEDSRGGVWWSVVDATSGHEYRVPTQAHATGISPRCVAVGDVLHIYYAVAAEQHIYVLVINPVQPMADVASTLLIDDFSATDTVYDAVPTTRAGSPSLLAWQEYGASNIRLSYITAAGTLGSPAGGMPAALRIVASVLTASPLTVAYKYVDGGDGDRLMVSWVKTGSPSTGVIATINGGTVATMMTVLATTTVYATPTSVQRIALAEHNGTARVAFEETAAEPSNRFCVVNSLVLGGAAGSQSTIRSVGLATRAFHAGADGDVFATFVHDTTYFNTYVVLRLSDFVPAGRHMPAEATGAPTRQHLSSVQVIDDVATFVLPYKTRLQSVLQDKFAASALRTVTLDFDNDASHQTAQYGAGSYMAAACPQHYDGRQWTEQGFHFGPEHIPAPVPGGGGGLTNSGVYEYVAWYEWTDAQGEIHRGPTSIGTSITLGGGNSSVTLTLPTLRVTRKTNVRICVGRCLNGDTSRFWRVSSLDPTTVGAANGFLANDTAVDTVTLLDELSDVDLQKQEELYTTGGVLSNDPAALGSHVAAGKNRLFFTDAQAGNIVRFSQRRAYGFGLEIAPELKHEVDPYGGDITAIAVMEDIVFVFKRSAIFAFNGDGPFENGSAGNGGGTVSGFSASQLIASDVGCINPSSIVLTPDGLMFQSAKGIYLLSHSRDVTYVGSPVEAFNDQDVRRAVTLPDRDAALFLTSSGLTLYYDYMFKMWSTFTNHEGYDAAVVDGEFYYLRTSDVVYKETIGAYSDAGTRIRLRFETAWLHMSDHLQGFERFWKALILGTWSSPHQLGISYRTSYQGSDTGGSWSEPWWVDATGDTSSAGWLTGETCNPIGEDPITGSVYGDGLYGEGLYGGTDQDVYQWRVGVHEDGQAIQFRFEDFEKNGLAGASFELTELVVVGGVKKVDFRPFSGSRST